MFRTKFQASWPFGSEEEVKNRFSRWPVWWPSWKSDRNEFSYFLSTSYPDASYEVSSQLDQWRGRLLKQIVDAARRTPHDRY